MLRMQETEKCFKVRSQEPPQSCLKYQVQKQIVIHWLTSWDSAKANVPYHKIADHVMMRGSNVNENSMSESIGCCSYDSYLKIVVIIYADQTQLWSSKKIQCLPRQTTWAVSIRQTWSVKTEKLRKTIAMVNIVDW